MKNVCVIGGSRYFGRHLVLGLRDAGVAVTLVNRGSVPPPEGVDHVVADRGDLGRALGSRTFDVVVDQVCATPLQAEAAVRVFTGRTGRYVMTSTIEVYDRAATGPAVPRVESSVDLAREPLGTDLPWHDPVFSESRYGQGKRQAEAVFTRQESFAFAAVRSGHVLGGADFTGRLAHYVDRMRDGRPILVRPENHPSSFIHHHEIAEFLRWAADADFTGPVNARSHGEFDVAGLCRTIASQGTPEPVFQVGGQASPFAFGHYYGMDNSRATRLGFSFSHTSGWLPEVIGEVRVPR